MAGPANPRPRPPRPRLASIRDPNSISPYRAKRATPQPVVRRLKASAEPCCGNPTISSEDGSTMCYNCGKVIDESDIVAEVTFAENAAGAAIVQGGFVGEGQRHANTMGGTMRGMGGIPSQEQAQYNGRDEIRKLCSALHLRAAIEENAFGWYKLALGHNFVQGRRIRNVAAVAIYLSARKSSENTLMLMDLAEKVHVNVYTLGDTYKQFLKKLMEEDPATLEGNREIQAIEPLMLKFCQRLEFGIDSHRVASDACTVLKRMNRDWMVQGRNPAGLCGACIILAARMNNFRRTVREVVYVVKVADTTIHHRLQEYKRTPVAAMSVQDFRDKAYRYRYTARPPSIWKREEKEKRLERKRKAQEQVEDDDGTGQDEGNANQADSSLPDAGPSTATRPETRAQKKRKTGKGKAKAVDPPAGNSGAASPTSGNGNDLYAVDINALEGSNAGLEAIADAAVDEDGSDGEAFKVPKKRGRPPKKREPIIVRDEDLEIEEEIEAEINKVIKKWEPIFKEFTKNENHAVLVKARDTARQLAEEHMPNGNVNTEKEIGDDEFEDDPDVATCVLDPDEVRLKERVWLTENEDWLRAQQAKLLALALEEAKGIVKKPKQKRKHRQMGDGSVLDGQPAASAAEAAKKMLERRAKHFSSSINYENLNSLFGQSPRTEGSTPESSGQDASPAASGNEVRPLAQAPPAVQVSNEEAEIEEDVEGDEEEEEDYPEQEYGDAAEEEFDDPQQYMDDEDVGFDEEETYDY